MPLSTLSKVCTGCTACKSACPVQCIEMRTDLFGFYYPEITSPDKCIKCDRCNNVCPINSKSKSCDEFRQAFLAFSNNSIIRERSSSGGIFSEIAINVLESAGVIYGAVYNNDFVVEHMRIDNLEDLNRCCGAKYSQSDLGETFQRVKSDLEAGLKVLFSGTPCQVAGLRSFLGFDYKFLICVDFVCHGIPSPRAWLSYKEYRSNKPIVSINMRSKETGWSHFAYSILFNYCDGSRYSAKSNVDPFLKLFVGDYINRESCEICHFKGIDRCSDITLADFWGVWDLHPEVDDNKGISAVITHTKKGKALLKACRERITAFEVPIEEIAEQNPSLVVSSKANPKRNLLLKMAINGDYDEIRKKFLTPPSFCEKIKCRIVAFLNRR